MEQWQTSYTFENFNNVTSAMLQPDQDRLKAPSMYRDRSSGSSHCSMVSSGGSYRDRHCSSSPRSHVGSPSSEYDKLQEDSDLPLFNIEEQGDPRISWIMYYDFVVTKQDAFYRLKPGYLATEKYPSRVERPKVKG